MKDDDSLEWWEMPKSTLRWMAEQKPRWEEEARKQRQQEYKKDYQRRRARKKFGAIAKRDGENCARCGATERLVVDHIVAIANGGTNDIENLQILCWFCNSHKGAKTIDYRGGG